MDMQATENDLVIWASHTAGPCIEVSWSFSYELIDQLAEIPKKLHMLFVVTGTSPKNGKQVVVARRLVPIYRAESKTTIVVANPGRYNVHATVVWPRRGMYKFRKNILGFLIDEYAEPVERYLFKEMQNVEPMGRYYSYDKGHVESIGCSTHTAVSVPGPYPWYIHALFIASLFTHGGHKPVTSRLDLVLSAIFGFMMLALCVPIMLLWMTISACLVFLVGKLSSYKTIYSFDELNRFSVFSKARPSAYLWRRCDESKLGVYSITKYKDDQLYVFRFRTLVKMYKTFMLNIEVRSLDRSTQATEKQRNRMAKRTAKRRNRLSKLQKNTSEFMSA